MLGKLLKYDFRETSRLVLPVLLCIIIISLFGKFLLVTDLYDSMPDYIQVLSLLAYIFLIFVCCVGVPIYLTAQFYIHFYSNRGYITHTLPVTTGQKLFSRIFMSYVMELLTFAACILSALILLYDQELFAKIIQEIPSVDTQFRGMIGMGFYSFLAMNIAVLLLGLLSKLLLFFAAISLGQFFQTHRILGAVGSYVVLHLINQVFSFIMMLVLSFSDMGNNALPDHAALIAFYGMNIGFLLLTTLMYYIICHYFMEKRLNMN